jgi:adenylate cyclase
LPRGADTHDAVDKLADLPHHSEGSGRLTSTMSILAELKRRNVLRVAAAYLVAAWLVIQVVETIAPSFGFGDEAVRIVTLVAAIGLVPTVVFAWVFQLTPEGIRKDKDIDPGEPGIIQAAKRLDRIILVILAVAVAYFAIDKFILLPPQHAGTEGPGELAADREASGVEAPVKHPVDRSIAVLAFDDLSQDKDQEYLSDGIAEELLNRLARIPELRVTSRHSAFYYKGKDTRLADVARELNVGHILEGSVRKSADRVRITAQLINTASDTQVWSETYDRDLGDIFVIQDEIAAAVAARLRIRLLGAAPRSHEADPKAYSLVLQARHVVSRATAEAYEQAILLLEEALAIDPQYVVPWDMLALIYATQAGRGLRPSEEGYSLATAMAERALAIDPEHAPAYARLGWIAMTHQKDLAAAAGYFEHALALDRADLSITANAAVLLQALGRIDQATALLEHIVDRDPVWAGGYYNLGYYYLAAGHWDDAIDSYQSALRLSPGRIGANNFIGIALLKKGDAQAARQAFEQEPHEVLRQLGLMMADHALGQTAESDNLMKDVIAQHAREWAYYIAAAFAFRGQTDQAFEWLEKSIEYNSSGLQGIIVNPLLTGLHSDPRWLPLLESMGKSPRQLDEIRFAVPRPD